jgi:hypothetical protein
VSERIKTKDLILGDIIGPSDKVLSIQSCLSGKIEVVIDDGSGGRPLYMYWLPDDEHAVTERGPGQPLLERLGDFLTSNDASIEICPSNGKWIVTIGTSHLFPEQSSYDLEEAIEKALAAAVRDASEN